ncbi:MAG: hypothetical protein FJ299_03045 [Planctomycetes bacterium]|nr:hypothetical protein [Planctomycetota bacterium]
MQPSPAEPFPGSRLLPAFLLLASPCAAQALWTVDDNGPADFASVQVAINTVAAGDVLLIEPGSYGAAVVNKSLTLLGSPGSARPAFASLDFIGAQHARALHLQTQALTVINITGHAFIDDCVVTDLETQIDNCADVSLANCTLGALPLAGNGVDGLSLFQCGYVQIVNSTITGGAGLSSSITFVPGAGGAGIRLEQSKLLLIGSTVRGGAGQTLTAPLFAGTGGDAVLVDIGSTAEVRGSNFDLLAGGLGNAGVPPFLNGVAIRAKNGGTAVTSGVSTTGGFNGPVTQVTARPYLEWSGAGGPGSSRTLTAYGAAGSICVMFLATDSFLDTGFSGTYGLPLLVHPGTIFLSTSAQLLGQNLGNGPTYPTPLGSALAGARFLAQGAVVGTSVQATNAVELMLSF